MGTTHRSAMGKSIDMSAVRSKNEKVRAIGNMSVNSRGDIIDSNNQVVNDGSQRVNRVYNKTTANPGAQQRTASSTKADTASLPAPVQTRVQPDPTPVVVAPPPVVEHELTAPVWNDDEDELSDEELEFDQELEQEIVPEKPESKPKKR